MNNCLKCNKKLPKHHYQDGKRKNTSPHRKFCFDCSPFGSHNTKNLVKIDTGEIAEKICSECLLSHRHPTKLCNNCFFKQRIVKLRTKLKAIVGDSCWVCGYNKSQRSLHFHHVNQEDKQTGLSIREIVGYAWHKIDIEMKKCIYVCANCHGEIHDDMITQSVIHGLWKQKWADIENKDLQINRISNILDLESFQNMPKDTTEN